MSLLKRLVTVLALLYLLVGLLLLFFPSVRTSSINLFSAYTLAFEVNFLLGFTWVGVIVVGLLLLVENLDSGLLRRTVSQQEQRINELKAQLFDAQKITRPAPPTTTVIAPPTPPAGPYAPPAADLPTPTGGPAPLR